MSLKVYLKLICNGLIHFKTQIVNLSFKGILRVTKLDLFKKKVVSILNSVLLNGTCTARISQAMIMYFCPQSPKNISNCLTQVNLSSCIGLLGNTNWANSFRKISVF